MSPINLIIAVFSVIAAVDRLFGNRLGLGKEFTRGFQLLGSMALSMIGIIVISPYLAQVLNPCFNFVYDKLGIDPSIIPASLFANDMGGAPLSVEVARDPKIGLFNALIVSSMMGCTISFSIPCSMEIVKKDAHREMLLGYLCGVATIPMGCLISGLLLRLPFSSLLSELLPLTVFAGIIVAGLLLCPRACVKVFEIFGWMIRLLITAGLILGIIRFLLGYEIVKGLSTLEEGALVCFNAAVVMTGAFPLLFLLSKILARPIRKLGRAMSINETSAMGLIATVATAMSTYEMMNEMDRKGVMLNAAFLVSAGFTFAGHLAFTMAFDASYIPYMIVGKITAGILALLFALILYPRVNHHTA